MNKRRLFKFYFILFIVTLLPAASLALRNSRGLGERRDCVLTFNIDCGVDDNDADGAGVFEGVFLLTGGV